MLEHISMKCVCLVMNFATRTLIVSYMMHLITMSFARVFIPYVSKSLFIYAFYEVVGPTCEWKCVLVSFCHLQGYWPHKKIRACTINVGKAIHII
jgi:hypothetical protein